jgi:putative transposase
VIGRSDADVIPAPGLHDALTDEEWQILAPLLPPETSGGRPRQYLIREGINGIHYVLRGGCAWRFMPHDLPPWQTACQTFRAWRQDGTWLRIHDQLRDEVRTHMGRHRQPSAAIIDVQTVKTTEKWGVHGYDGAKKLNGRKRHLLVETRGRLLRVLVHPADLRDAAMAPWLLAAAHAACDMFEEHPRMCSPFSAQTEYHSAFAGHPLAYGPAPAVASESVAG